MKNPLIPWSEAEAVLKKKTWLDELKARLGLSYRQTYILKNNLKEAAGMDDEEFKADWNNLKEKGRVRQVFVKIQDGVVIDILDPQDTSIEVKE